MPVEIVQIAGAVLFYIIVLLSFDNATINIYKHYYVHTYCDNNIVMLLVFCLRTAPAKTAPIATAREGSDALQIILYDIIYNNNIIYLQLYNT